MEDDASFFACLRDTRYGAPLFATSAETLTSMTRRQRSLLDYESCSVSELEVFCYRRKIPILKPLIKAELVAKLEWADEEVGFRFFMDLSPELRCICYDLYFKSLPKDLSDPSEPPIAKTNRLICEESVPLFYQTCTFTFYLTHRVKVGCRRMFTGDFRSSPLDRLDDNKLKWLKYVTIKYRTYKFFHTQTLQWTRGRKAYVRCSHGLLSPKEQRVGRMLVEYLEEVNKRSETPYLTKNDVKELKMLIRASDPDQQHMHPGTPIR